MSLVRSRPLLRARGPGGMLFERRDGSGRVVERWSDGLVKDDAKGYPGYPNFDAVNGPTQPELDGAKLVPDTTMIRFGTQPGRANPSILKCFDVTPGGRFTCYVLECPRDEEDDYEVCTVTPAIEVILHLQTPAKTELSYDNGSSAVFDVFGEVHEHLTSDGWHAKKHTITDAYLGWVAREIFNMATWTKSSRVKLVAFGGVALTNVPKIALKIEGLIAAARAAAAA